MNVAPCAALSPAAAAGTMPSAIEDSLRRARRLLAAAVLGLVVPLALVRVSGAVIAWGEVEPAGGTRVVAHPAGGTVAEVRVANGQRVRAGQILLRLDDGTAGADAELALASEEQLLARAARLQAERDGLPALDLGPWLQDRRSEPAARAAIAREERLFALSMAAVSAQQAALRAQIAQASAAAQSSRDQAETFRRQEVLIAQERKANDALWERRFTTLQRRNELIRAAVGIEGSVATATAHSVQALARVAELREQLRLAVTDARRRAAIELAEVEARLLALRRDVRISGQAGDRAVLRAPADGVVERLAQRSPGGLVRPGEPILAIVPDREDLRITARVTPRDVGRLAPGQLVTVRVSGADVSRPRELAGRLVRVGTDAVHPAEAASYFEAEIAVMAGRQPGGAGSLRAGMPAEVFIRTGSRTLLSYLSRPLSEQIGRAFR